MKMTSFESGVRMLALRMDLITGDGRRVFVRHGLSSSLLSPPSDSISSIILLLDE
jgi:hypothetical protein